MNTQKLEQIILHLNRYQKLPDDAVQDALIALNLALLVAQEEYPLPEPPRAKDTHEPEPLPLSLRDIRKMEGITQDTLAQRMSAKGRGKGYQAQIMHIEKGRNSPSVSTLKDLTECLGFTLGITATRDGVSYPLDVNVLASSRAKDASKAKKLEE